MAINVSVQYPRHDIVDPMLLPLGNPIKYHEEVLSLQPMLRRSRCVQVLFEQLQCRLPEEQMSSVVA